MGDLIFDFQDHIFGLFGLQDHQKVILKIKDQITRTMCLVD